MFKKTHDELELESLIEKEGPELMRTFLGNFKTQTDTLSLIIKSKSYADSNNMESNQVFWNAAGFINMCSYDLKIIMKEMTFATDDWGKRYFARQICHLIYELTNDLFEILGKDFRNQIDKLINNDTLKNTLTNIKESLNQFKSEHFARLKEIRNVSSAHRDKDFILQLKLIESISWIDTIAVASKFDKILNELGKVIQQLLIRSSSELDRGK